MNHKPLNLVRDAQRRLALRVHCEQCGGQLRLAHGLVGFTETPGEASLPVFFVCRTCDLQTLQGQGLPGYGIRTIAWALAALAKEAGIGLDKLAQEFERQKLS